MQFSTAAVAAAVAIMAPAPALANLPELAGFVAEVAGNIALLVEEANSKRSVTFDGKVHGAELERRQDGVAQEEFDRCAEDLDGVTITANTEGEASLEISGVPASCMNLANVLVGDGQGPFATPCGSDCLQYLDANEDEVNEILDMLR